MLKGKVVWLFSTEAWGKQLLSKHHYAIACKEAGAEVFFFNPPTINASFQPTISITEEGVNSVIFSPLTKGLRFIPASIKRLFNGIRFYTFVKYILYPDFIFCFDADISNVFFLFKKVKKALFIYDLKNNYQIQQTKLNSADLIVTISNKIKEQLSSSKPILVLQHGLNPYFEKFASESLNKVELIFPTKVNVLFIGSLFKMTIDYALFTSLVKANPTAKFHFFGAYRDNENNLGGEKSETTIRFIKFLQEADNTVLHGAVHPKDIVNYLSSMSCCIHLQHNSHLTDISNAHKLIEYMSTGLPVYATEVIGQNIYDEFFYKADKKVETFNNFLLNFRTEHNFTKRRKQIEYALDHTYTKNLQKITSSLISE